MCAHEYVWVWVCTCHGMCVVRGHFPRESQAWTQLVRLTQQALLPTEPAHSSNCSLFPQWYYFYYLSMHRLKIKPLLIHAHLMLLCQKQANNKNVTSFLVVLKPRWFEAISTIVRNYFGRVDCSFPASRVTLWSNGTSSFLREGACWLRVFSWVSCTEVWAASCSCDVPSRDVIRRTLPSDSLLPVHPMCSNRGAEFSVRFTMWICCTMSLLVIMASGKYLYQLLFRI